LALAIALVRDPQLLLLDEPHAGLDAEGRAVLDEVLRQAAGQGRAVVLASHELDRARALADREVVLRAGQAHAALAPTVEEQEQVRKRESANAGTAG
jgi:ABC-type multidrug transport system ATPase subunit